MKRFRFKLQTLLDHRKSREEELLGELAVLRREEHEELVKLDKLSARFDDARARYDEALRHNEQPDHLSRHETYSLALRDDIGVQHLTINAVRERINAKLDQVVEAMMNRQVLEKLRGNQEAAHIVSEQRIEQNSLDEMANVRYAREM
jgi:flagellar export protein FliJ